MKNRNSWLASLAICLGLVICAIAIPIASAEKTVVYDPYNGVTRSIYINNKTIYRDFDINMDGKVDETDLQLLEEAYGETGAPGWIREDINKDGKVDQIDAKGLVNHYGEVYDPYFGIQKAIDFANDGDTIYVANGTYTENIVINKQVTIVGNGTNKTIIDGNKQDAIHLDADGAQISGITITNSDYGLIVTGSGNKIYKNKFYNNRENVEDYGTNTYKMNYFDDYQGYDADNDGIGDTIHYIYKDNGDAQVTGRFNALSDAPSTVKIQDCDINTDYKIDAKDLKAVMTKYKQEAKGTPGWIKEDIVKDGVVDIIDVCAVKKYMGKTYDEPKNSKNNSKFNSNINNTIVQRWQKIYDALSEKLPRHSPMLRTLQRIITHWQTMKIAG